MPQELIHPVSGKLRELSAGDFLDLFDESVRSKILESAARYPDREAIVCFENLDMCSSQLGCRSALVVGPSNTYTLEKAASAHLNDLPSRRQYPVAFCRPS